MGGFRQPSRKVWIDHKRWLAGMLVAGLLCVSGRISGCGRRRQARRRGQRSRAETITCSISHGSAYSTVFCPIPVQLRLGRARYRHRRFQPRRQDGCGPRANAAHFLRNNDRTLAQPVSTSGSVLLATGDFNHDGWDDVAPPTVGKCQRLPRRTAAWRSVLHTTAIRIPSRSDVNNDAR
jgi:hypothetical protein